MPSTLALRFAKIGVISRAFEELAGAMFSANKDTAIRAFGAVLQTDEDPTIKACGEILSDQRK
jgi:hypothetical protein